MPSILYNGLDPNRTSQSLASDQGLHSLLNIKYRNFYKSEKNDNIKINLFEIN